jgi:shikimate 5-dehydrogenase
MNNVPSREARRILFVGIATTGSAALTAFPAWAKILRLDAVLEGVDLPPDADAAVYRELVEHVGSSPDLLGAVVTAHKAKLFQHAAALIDEVDDSARLCREVSVISRRNGVSIGTAIDPASVRRTLAAMLPAGHWRDRRADLFCFGAGGTASAIMVALFANAQSLAGRPRRVVATDIDRRRLDNLRALLGQIAPDVPVELRLSEDRAVTGAELAEAAPGSLIVNATGLGKDRPGAPIALPAQWPPDAVVWDLNYRGQLLFLRDAEAQKSARGLRVHDGWALFLHGWTEALGELIGRAITPGELARMGRAAERYRTSG